MTEITRRGAGALLLATAAVGIARANEPTHWRAGFTTPPDTLDSELVRIEGRLPADLRGAFYRVGPAQFERAGERLGHWFDGDGMVQRFAIADGRIRHRGRFVMTEKRRRESEAGRFLYSGYGFAPAAATGIARPDDLNAANTALLPMGDDVWALWEGGSPYRVDAATLETRGRKSFDSNLDGLPFSAHPKRGPDGEVWNFGVFGRRCVLWRLAPDGAVRQSAVVELPQASLMHDFAVTERSIVLLLPPLLMTRAEGSSLIDRCEWRSERPFMAMVIDKATMTTQRVYEMPARFLFHIGNAWEDEAGTIRLDACVGPDATFATTTARQLSLGHYAGAPDAHPTQIVLHADGRADMSALAGIGEFPRIDPRRVGLRHRYSYGISGSGYAAWDWESGTRRGLALGERYWTEEPVFTPRPGRTGENEGWLIATALDVQRGRTEVLVLDAARVADGPVARFACGYAVPLGFHGAFVAA